MCAEINSIKKPAQFRKVYDFGEKKVSSFFLVFISKQDFPGLEIGITVTKKQGNAVIRNRIKRRLRALVMELYRVHHNDFSHKIVIVAKKASLEGDFAKMLSSLESLLGLK